MLSHDLARELLARRNNDVRVQVLIDDDPTGETYEAKLVELRDQDETLDTDLRAEPVLSYDELADAVVIRAGAVLTRFPGTWLERAVMAFGKPHLDHGQGIDIGDAWRRCWIFDGGDKQNFNLAIDLLRDGKFHTSANSPGHQAKLFTDAEPTDAELRTLLAFAWPGFEAAS